MLGRQARGIGVAQNVEALGVGLHHAVFDAVVHHLDEMAGAARAGMDIAALDARIAAARGRACAEYRRARRERGEDRVEPLDLRLVAADHHAVAALEAPDAAAGADVEVLEAVLGELAATANVVLPKGVAAVDDRVALAAAGRSRSGSSTR